MKFVRAALYNHTMRIKVIQIDAVVLFKRIGVYIIDLMKLFFSYVIVDIIAHERGQNPCATKRIRLARIRSCSVVFDSCCLLGEVPDIPHLS